jgi:Zn-dependent M32 family carboxypeptidase
MRIHKLMQERQKETLENSRQIISTTDALNAKLDMLLDKYDQDRERRIREDLVGRIRRQDSKIRKQERKSTSKPHTATVVSRLIFAP